MAASGLAPQIRYIGSIPHTNLLVGNRHVRFRVSLWPILDGAPYELLEMAGGVLEEHPQSQLAWHGQHQQHPPRTDLRRSCVSRGMQNRDLDDCPICFHPEPPARQDLAVTLRKLDRDRFEPSLGTLVAQVAPVMHRRGRRNGDHTGLAGLPVLTAARRHIRIFPPDYAVASMTTGFARTHHRQGPVRASLHAGAAGLLAEAGS
jgi:hypothetical protein